MDIVQYCTVKIPLCYQRAACGGKEKKHDAAVLAEHTLQAPQHHAF